LLVMGLSKLNLTRMNQSRFVDRFVDSMSIHRIVAFG
jgi:hypothetical protein